MAKNKTRKPRSKAAIYKKQAMHEKLIQANHAYIYKKGENIGYTEATIIMLWLLHTEYGFGKVRLARFLRQIMSFCEAYIVPTPDNREEGEFTGLGLEDMASALKEECDISIDWQRGLIDIDNILIVKEGEEHDGTAEAEEPAGPSAD